MLVLAWTTQVVVLCGMVGVNRAGAAGLGVGEVADVGGEWEEGVAQAASQVVQRYLAGCHLVLAAPRPSRALPHLIRRFSVAGELAVFLQPCGDATLLHGSLNEKVFPGNDGVPNFWREVWGASKATCRAFLLDLTTCGTNTADRMLSWTGLFLQPRTRVIVIGGRQDVNKLFQFSGLRNSLYVVYITPALTEPKEGTEPTENVPKGGVGRVMETYHRCLYCTGRQARPRLLLHWNLQDGIPEGFEMFGGQAELFMGRKMNIVSLSYYPYIKYKVVYEGSSSKLQFEDSLNTRMLTALAPKLNFTYIMREPTDKLWGAAAGGGNWTGVVGTLQHELADLSMDLTLTPGRAEVVEFSRAYIDESLVILSSKPKPLPEYLSVVRPLEGQAAPGTAYVLLRYRHGYGHSGCAYGVRPPAMRMLKGRVGAEEFLGDLHALLLMDGVAVLATSIVMYLVMRGKIEGTAALTTRSAILSCGEVWGAIVVCVMVWGTVLWVMERLSHWISGRRYLSFTSSIFYGWGLLLEDHPFEPPPSPPSQVGGGLSSLFLSISVLPSLSIQSGDVLLFFFQQFG
ncbi:Glutamate receptor ionotropic, delta-1 [Portunus trituberculatus]|uniref:Glutamate receptor ionotropic, delta-1 n=1 Tax=Portunus trituberculatus TaxID=210409 RepID=A0A5B7E4P2_PORTR|nr:Glutamate receptor ionotropic, delta-1 [Portunus trituberculatus]